MTVIGTKHFGARGERIVFVDADPTVTSVDAPAGSQIVSIVGATVRLFLKDDDGDTTNVTELGAGGVTDHGALTGLADDDHSQYARLAGRATGQALQGGTASGENLSLESTANATKGAVRVLDNLEAQAAVRLSGIITPPDITATTDDYNPTGLSRARILRLTTTGFFGLNGIVAQDDAIITIVNVGPTNTLRLVDQAGSSAAANRIISGEPVGAIDLVPDNAATLWYDTATLRWRVISVQQ